MTKLNQHQKNAAENILSNSLIIAGPGTGKTKTLIERIKNTILYEKRCDNILVLTFTEKATEEIKERLIFELGIDQVNELFVSTFHGFCNRILNEYYDIIGKKYVILDEYQRYSFYISKINDLFNKKYLKKAIERSHEILHIYDIFALYNPNLEKLKKSIKDPFLLEIVDSYLKYEKLLDYYEYIDYAHLQKFFYKQLCENKEFLEKIKKRFKYIFIDEHQDTDPLQDKIIQIISNNGKDMVVCAVGDEDQSIYGFRGATIENFRKFEENYENVKLHYLTINYRSYSEIIEFYDNYMKKFRKYPKKIESFRGKGGNNVILKSYKNKEDEANKILKLIKYFLKKGAQYRDITILFRSVKHQTKEIIEILEKNKIPYTKIEGVSNFLNNKYIKSVLYNLSKVYGCLNDLNSLFKKRKIQTDNSIIDTIDDLNRDHKISENYYKIIRRLNIDKLNDTNKRLLGLLSELINDYEMFNNPKNFKKFIKMLFYSPDHIIYEKIKEQIMDENTIKLMTIHQSKGLEFPIVIIAGFNKKMWFKKGRFNRLPDKILSILKRNDVVNEDHRILYVGMSRAMDVLAIIGKPKLMKETFGISETQENIKNITSKKTKTIIKKKYDFSMINQYLTCPYLYDKTYNYGFKQPSHFSQEYGNLLHTLLLYVNKRYKNKLKVDYIKIKEIIKKHKKIKRLNKINEEKILDLIKKYEKNYLGKKIKKILSTEYKIEKIYEKYTIIGIIDLLFEDDQGNLCILDFKARKVSGLEETNVKVQLNLYNDLLKNKIKKPLKLFAYSIEDCKLVEIKEEKVDHIIKSLTKEEDLNKKNIGNPFCKYCLFKCDKYK